VLYNESSHARSPRPCADAGAEGATSCSPERRQCSWEPERTAALRSAFCALCELSDLQAAVPKRPPGPPPGVSKPAPDVAAAGSPTTPTAKPVPKPIPKSPAAGTGTDDIFSLSLSLFVKIVSARHRDYGRSQASCSLLPFLPHTLCPHLLLVLHSLVVHPDHSLMR
jgi:hypothetical protein